MVKIPEYHGISQNPNYMVEIPGYPETKHQKFLAILKLNLEPLK